MTNYITEKLVSTRLVRKVNWIVDKDEDEFTVPDDLTANGAKFGSLQTALIKAAEFPSTLINIEVLIGPHGRSISIDSLYLPNVSISGTSGTSNITGNLTLSNVVLNSINGVNFFGGCYLTNTTMLNSNSIYFANFEANNSQLKFSRLIADSVLIDNNSSVVVNSIFDVRPQDEGEAIVKVQNSSVLILRGGADNIINNGYLLVSNNSSANISQLTAEKRIAAINYSQIYAPNLTLEDNTLIVAKNNSYIQISDEISGEILYSPALNTIDYTNSQINAI